MPTVTLKRGPLPDAVWEHTTVGSARRQTIALCLLYLEAECNTDENDNAVIDASEHYTRNPVRA